MTEVVNFIIMLTVYVFVYVFVYIGTKRNVVRNILSGQKTFMFIADADEDEATVIINNKSYKIEHERSFFKGELYEIIFVKQNRRDK